MVKVKAPTSVGGGGVGVGVGLEGGFCPAMSCLTIALSSSLVFSSAAASVFKSSIWREKGDEKREGEGGGIGAYSVLDVSQESFDVFFLFRACILRENINQRRMKKKR